jgi:hypothetical protein
MPDYFSRKRLEARIMDVMNEARELLPVIRWCWQGRSVTPDGNEVKCPKRLNQQQGRRAAFGILADNGWAMIDIQPDDRLVVMEARKPGLDKDDFGPQVAKALHAIGWPMAFAGAR